MDFKHIYTKEYALYIKSQPHFVSRDGCDKILLRRLKKCSNVICVANNICIIPSGIFFTVYISDGQQVEEKCISVVADIRILEHAVLFSRILNEEKIFYFREHYSGFETEILSGFPVESDISYTSGFIVVNSGVETNFYTTTNTMKKYKGYEYMIRDCFPTSHDKTLKVVNFKDGQQNISLKELSLFQSSYINDQLENGSCVYLDLNSNLLSDFYKKLMVNSL